MMFPTIRGDETPDWIQIAIFLGREISAVAIMYIILRWLFRKTKFSDDWRVALLSSLGLGVMSVTLTMFQIENQWLETLVAAALALPFAPLVLYFLLLERKRKEQEKQE